MILLEKEFLCAVKLDIVFAEHNKKSSISLLLSLESLVNTGPTTHCCTINL